MAAAPQDRNAIERHRPLADPAPQPRTPPAYHAKAVSLAEQTADEHADGTWLGPTETMPGRNQPGIGKTGALRRFAGGFIDIDAMAGFGQLERCTQTDHTSTNDDDMLGLATVWHD